MSARSRWAAALLLLAAGCGGDAADGTPAPDTEAATPAAPAPLPPVEAGSLAISSVAAPEPVTGERTALYLVVANRGETDDALEGIATAAAARATLHRTESRDGVSTMRPADAVPVPAGGEARLAPGGFHGMLEGLAAPLSAGDTVAVTLRFRDAGEVEVRARVVPYAELDALYPPAAEPAAADHGSHGGGGA